MATSTRPRRAAAPSAPPAEHAARNDSAAKKPAAKKTTAAKTASKKPAAPPEAVPVPLAPAASRKAAARTAAKAAPTAAALPVGTPERAPAARKTTKATAKPAATAAEKAPAKKAGGKKPAPVPEATPVAAPAQASAEKTPAATPAAAGKPPARSPATKGAAAKPAAAPAPAKKAAGKGRGKDRAAAVSRVKPAASPEASAPEASAPEAATPAPAQAPAPHDPSTPAHSAVVLQGDEHRQLRWIAGRDCPDALRAAAMSCTDEAGQLQLDNDDALPTLLREAALAGHPLQVDPAAWQQLARRRDARRRLFVLEHAYPDGPASAALHSLLRAPLAPFQAEGALFAACAGRALLADERGLGKTVQALAAAMLLHRHAGVERVLIHCTADQRLSWQREAARFLGAAAPEWRVVSDEPGGPHAEAIDAWKPGLVVIDEPARLARWDRIDAPFALVLCGTPLDGDAALADALVAYLDRHREGPLARLRTRSAHRDGSTLDEALQALMLRRRRADVAPQLPARVVSERVLPLGSLQRAVHDRAAAAARAVLAGWRRTRQLPDAQQWELGCAMQAMREACHRAEPGQADSPLAEHTLSALIVLTSELLGHAGLRIAAVAPRPADVALIAERLAQAGQGGDRCTVVPAGAPLPGDAEVVVAIGMPWTTPAADGRPRQWIHLLAEHSIDTALYDTRELRDGIASTPAEGGHDGFLHGSALQRYLLAAEAALAALPPAPAAAA